MRSICNILRPKIFALLTPIVCLSFISYSNIQILATELGDGHNRPMVSLGDRNAMLAFIATQLPSTKNIQLEFNLLDIKTGNNIQHTTYLVTVSYENRRLFRDRS